MSERKTTRKLDSLLRKYKRKTKKSLRKETYTEFFYVNTHRKVIEFLSDENEELLLNKFLKEFLPSEIKEFCELGLFNEMDEEIKNWYYENETLIIKIQVKWGFSTQDLVLDIDIENFYVNLYKNGELSGKNIDIELLNNFLINYIISQSENISKIYDSIKKRVEGN